MTHIPGQPCIPQNQKRLVLSFLSERRIFIRSEVRVSLYAEIGLLALLVITSQRFWDMHVYVLRCDQCQAE